MNSRNKICFLHITKCAGSSILRLAQNTDRKFYPVQENGIPKYSGGYNFGFTHSELTPDEVKFSTRIPYWTWDEEMRQNFIETMPCDFFAIESILTHGLPKAEGLRFFVLLREPIARSLSHYYQILEDGYSPVSIEKFFSGKIPGMDNYMTRFLSGRSHEKLTEDDFERARDVLGQIDLVLTTEQINDQISRFLEIGWDLADQSLSRSGSNYSSQRKPVPSDLLPLAKRFNSWDVKLYDCLMDSAVFDKNIRISQKTRGLPLPGYGQSISQNLFYRENSELSNTDEGEAVCADSLGWENPDMSSERLLFLLKQSYSRGDYEKGLQLFFKNSKISGTRAVHFYYMRLISEKLNACQRVLPVFKENADRYMQSSQFLKDYEEIAISCEEYSLAYEINTAREKLYDNFFPDIFRSRFWIHKRAGDYVEAAMQSHILRQVSGWNHEEQIYHLSELAFEQGDLKVAKRVNSIVKESRSLDLALQRLKILESKSKYLAVFFLGYSDLLKIRESKRSE